jgi:hypothetical protein
VNFGQQIVKKPHGLLLFVLRCKRKTLLEFFLQQGSWGAAMAFLLLRLPS